jgi:hypothetical protein
MTSREEFEENAGKRGYNLDKTDVHYVSQDTHERWLGWEAGRATLQAATRDASSSAAISDVQAERKRQDAQWGGAAHDDAHGSRDWFRFIGQQQDKCREAITEVLHQQDCGHITNAYGEALIQAETRVRLVKIAALAIAGIESIDRAASVPKGDGND